MGVNSFMVTSGTKIMAPFWDRSKHELIFARSIAPNLKYDLQFTFHVAFGDIEIVAGQPTVPILRGFADIVEGVLMGIEAETKRIVASRL